MSKLMQGQLQKYLTFMLVGYFAVSMYGSSGQTPQGTAHLAACCETNCDTINDLSLVPCIVPPRFVLPYVSSYTPTAPTTEKVILSESQEGQNARAPPFLFG